MNLDVLDVDYRMNWGSKFEIFGPIKDLRLSRRSAALEGWAEFRKASPHALNYDFCRSNRWKIFFDDYWIHSCSQCRGFKTSRARWWASDTGKRRLIPIDLGGRASGVQSAADVLCVHSGIVYTALWLAKLLQHWSSVLPGYVPRRFYAHENESTPWSRRSWLEELWIENKHEVLNQASLSVMDMRNLH